MIFEKPLRDVILVVALLSSASLLPACGGSGSSSEPGISLAISAQLQPTPNPDSSITALPAGAKQFENSEGVTISITRAYLVISSVELASSCDSSAFARFDLQSLPRAIVELLIPSAQAHTAASPTKTGEPNVINLLAADLARVDIGDLAPPANSYCGLTAELFAADEDAVGLPQDVDMVGRTVYIEGQYDSGATSLPFTVDTSIALLPASMSFDAPLVLDSSHRTAEITVQISYQRWFDGVDFANINSDAQRNIVLNNIRESLAAVSE